MAAKVDLTGQRFGRWVVLGDFGSRQKTSVKWRCRCDCGNERDIFIGNLKDGKSKSCGCLMREQASEARVIDLTGQRFNRLTVVGDSGKRRKGDVLWTCRCDCGNEILTASHNLKSGNSGSCGCMRKETLTKHGMANTPEYHRLASRNRRARKRNSGGSHTLFEINNLFFLQRGRCAVCKTKLLKNRLHADHIMPISLNGRNDISNIQLLCQHCNQVKWMKHPTDFMQSQGYLL
ncbi:MAG: HNH endonuclease [Candidatus Contendobacter sp.]|nr:HNH endonuclease [Candidatus Contendobacter sp.]